MVACVRSRMNEVSQVERFLFSKIHFLVKDDKHVIVQVFARFGEISGLAFVLAMGTNHCPNRAKTCTITYKNRAPNCTVTYIIIPENDISQSQAN